MAIQSRLYGRKPYWWKDEYYVTIYKLVKAGGTIASVAKTLGIHQHGLEKAIKRDEALAKIFEEGKEEQKFSLVDHVIGTLPKKLRLFWERIVAAEKGEGEFDPEELSKLGTRSRQLLFCHALVYHNFSITKACQTVNISGVAVYARWFKQPQFKALLERLHQAKKDLFESALIKLVRNGDSAAVLFANRTLNRDRGYNDKVQVDVTGEITHKVSLDQLPTQLKQQLLDEIRRQSGVPQLEGPKVVDAEVEE